MPGYTKFDNSILEKVLTSNLTKRQLKILLLIVRFSSGCQKNYEVLRKSDYAYAGISPYCVTGELEKLVKLRVVKWDPKRDLVWLNSKGVRRCNLKLKSGRVCRQPVTEREGRYGLFWSCPQYREHAPQPR
jgi:hypothetical protein